MCMRTFFFVPGKAEANRTPRCERSPRVVRPHKFSCRSLSWPQTSGKGGGNSPADLSYATTATKDPRYATPEERPPDTLPRWPSASDGEASFTT